MSAAVLLITNKLFEYNRQTKNRALPSSSTNQSAQRGVREQCTRQNNPYRLGTAPAGVVGARSRCCPAATVPAAVVLPCGVCGCIAGNQKTKNNKKSSTEQQSSAIIVHKPKRTATSTRTIHKAEHSLPICRGAGRSSRGTKPLLSSSDGARSCRIPLRCRLLYC